MNINYEYYRIFYYVVKYGNFTKAANVLFSNQPNVTRSMNRLEEELGCKLFLRTNRGISLTPEGERLYAHVETAIVQLQAGEAELESSAVLQSGSISIGATETALHFLLLERIRAFHTKYPGIHLHISNHTTSHAIDALKNGAVDIAVIATPAVIERPLKETLLLPFREVLVGGDAYASLSGKKMHFEDLSDFPLITLGKNSAHYAFYNKLFLKHNMVLQTDTEAATADQLLPLVKCNLGLSFVPEPFAKSAIASGEVFEIPLDVKIPERHIALVQDSRKALSVAGREFIKTLL